MSYEDKSDEQLREDVAALEPTLDLCDWSRGMLITRLDQFYADSSDEEESPFSAPEHEPTAGVRENTSDEDDEEEEEYESEEDEEDEDEEEEDEEDDFDEEDEEEEYESEEDEDEEEEDELPKRTMTKTKTSLQRRR